LHGDQHEYLRFLFFEKVSETIDFIFPRELINRNFSEEKFTKIEETKQKEIEK
jgi:predicted alternative tryptophan synthase beta-subunit